MKQHKPELIPQEDSKEVLQTKESEQRQSEQLLIDDMSDHPGKRIRERLSTMISDCSIGQLHIKLSHGGRIGTVTAIKVSYYADLEEKEVIKTKVILFTAAHHLLIEDEFNEVPPWEQPVKGFKFHNKVFMLLNKAQSPAKPEDWGLPIQLVMDKRHVLVPSKYDGSANCGYDIAVIKVPDEYQSQIKEYMHDHRFDERMTLEAK